MSLSSVSSRSSLAHIREQFPALKNKTYFNFGGQGPLAERSLQAILHAHAHLQEIGPFTQAANRWVTQEANATRAAIATDLGVAPSTITLTENVTVGCNIPLWGIDWQPGDHVILSDCEHPGIIATLLELQERFQIELTTCALMETLNQGDPVAAITQHIRPQTRMVVISHILWNTGQVLPLKEIAQACHASAIATQPIHVMVDAAQSVGVLPLNSETLNLAALEVDSYAFTGHKWLCGAAGLGGLYVRPEIFETLRPTFIGWRGITKDESGYPTGWEPDGRRFEVSTSNVALAGALRQAIALHNEWGTTEDRYQQICSLSAKLWQHLVEMPRVTCLRTAPPEAGLVSFQIEGANHGELVQALEKKGFMLRTLLDPDCIRACVHYFTLESEIEELVEVMRSLLS